MELIRNIEVGAGGSSSIEFTDIPQNYSQLCLLLSARGSSNSERLAFTIEINTDTGSNYSYRGMIGYDNNQILPNSSSGTPAQTPQMNITGNNATTGSFGNVEIWFPDYTSSASKSIRGNSTAPNNNAADHILGMDAGLYTTSSAISSIKLGAQGHNFVELSMASLYGIPKYNAATAPKATGGIISYDATNDYWVHTFTASGTFTPTEDMTCEYLVIAGGGGGGGALSANAGFGAGGAGGYRCSVSGESSGGGASAETPLSLTASTGYTVTIGAGGAGGAAGNNNNGVKGSDSTLHTITSEGGGYGSSTTAGGNGGSGGGGRYNSVGGSGATSQGFKGGDNTPSPTFGGASGGGAGAAGGQGSGDFGAYGGIGVQSSITGTAIYRAGGGGGGSHGTSATGGNGGLGGGGVGQSNGVPAASGFPSFGGGGGSANGTLAGAGGSGGSGVVIVRYAA